jgi:hypothetical protein
MAGSQKRDLPLLRGYSRRKDGKIFHVVELFDLVYNRLKGIEMCAGIFVRETPKYLPLREGGGKVKKVLDKKTLEREAAFWGDVKKHLERDLMKGCHK